MQPAVWKKGKPAPFQGWPSLASTDRYSPRPRYQPAENIKEDINAALSELGYFFPKFQAGIELNSDNKTADLIIDILDEGPPADIGSIDISGNKINSKEDIMQYLGIESGMTFTREDHLNVKRKLWESARFIKAEVTPMKPAATDDKILLHFNLVEYPHAPPLTKSLSPEEETLLKLHKWLADNTHWEADLIIRAKTKITSWK